MVKKSMRVDMERVDKIYIELDKALRNMNIKITGAELLLACFYLLRTLEKAGTQKVQVQMERK